MGQKEEEPRRKEAKEEEAAASAQSALCLRPVLGVNDRPHGERAYARGPAPRKRISPLLSLSLAAVGPASMTP